MLRSFDVRLMYWGKKEYVERESSTSIQLFTEFVQFLYGLTQKKCPYKDCKKVSRQVKKEGANKFFLASRDSHENN